ncbi:NUDIX hydrolase [Cyclobacteriaceae bacterium]|jgi:8-oxo-dGTP pyrophosphatase MutT (NUDIX family)|nr:NUDIX hydrolase [Cyclobacteriaceae bacterium]|tara:strand:+ start:230 stop:769 length:540 start_codon:yes stop_codon:yes gene_type:complete
MKSLWIKKSSLKVFENPWIVLHDEQVINPRGGESQYGRIHFKHAAMGIIPMDDDLNTYLVGQWRYPLNAYSWEIPMGGGQLDQDLLGSAKRELLEETGITATRWQELSKVHLSNSVSDEVGYIYLAKGLTFGATQFDESEDLMIKKLPLKKAIEMCLEGSITDSLSLIGLLKLARTYSF